MCAQKVRKGLGQDTDFTPVLGTAVPKCVQRLRSFMSCPRFRQSLKKLPPGSKPTHPANIADIAVRSERDCTCDLCCHPQSLRNTGNRRLHARAICFAAKVRPRSNERFEPTDMFRVPRFEDLLASSAPIQRASKTKFCFSYISYVYAHPARKICAIQPGQDHARMWGLAWLVFDWVSQGADFVDYD